MPPSYNRIPPIERIPTDMTDAVATINARIDEINQVLAEIALADSSLRGTDSFQPTLFNNIDMQRNRVRNVERSKDPRDVVTRVELEEIGILGNPEGVSFTGAVNFEITPTSSGAVGGGSNSLGTSGEITDTINDILEGELVVSVSGEIVDERELSVNGTTRGTLAMGIDGQNRAAFVRLVNGAQKVVDPCTNALLTLILQELRRLNDATDRGSAVK